MLGRVVSIVLMFSVAGLAGACLRRADDSLALPDTDTQAAPSRGPVLAVSWLGKDLVFPDLPADTRQLFETKLGEAQREANLRPDDVHAQIWLGRRLAYLGRFDEAIAVYSEAIERWPNQPELYRHRGHRYLTTRLLDAARADFVRAAELTRGQPDEVEPDGLPNAKNQPRSTLQGNIHYHLGLVEFLRGDLSAAETGFRQALAVADNDDARVAVLHWLYVVLRRQGQHAAATAELATVTPNLDVIENHGYHKLLLFYLGEKSANELLDVGSGLGQGPAVEFGLAHYWLVEGQTQPAYAAMHQLVSSSRWDAFGAIAAEAELARRHPIADREPAVSAAAFDLPTVLGAWARAWQTYDLDAVDRLFLPSARLTYFSSEKPGRITGIEAIREHHRGFGLVPGGKAAAKILWVDDPHQEAFGDAVIVTGTWLFGHPDEQDERKIQRGPFSFVYVYVDGGYRIAHAHFANDPPQASAATK